MSLTSIEREKWKTIKRALDGDPLALDAVVTALGEKEVYNLFIDETVPFTMNTENVWTDLTSYTLAGIPAALYKYDIRVAWTVDSANTRVSRVRWKITSGGDEEITTPFTAVTTSALDQVNASSFTELDFRKDQEDITFTLQGFLDVGGGAVQLNFTEYRARLERVVGSNLVENVPGAELRLW